MKRFIQVSRFAALTLGLAGLAAVSGPSAGQGPKAKPFQDPERAFQLGDIDKDGNLTRDEFGKLTANNPRLKENPKAADFLFTRLDADRDGKLTLPEYRAIAELRTGQFKGKAFPPKKGDARKEEPSAAVSDKPTPEQLAFFEKKIRPILVGQCYSCHSEEAKKEKGNLLLDTRDGIRKGGDTGPAVVPGQPGRSLLLSAIRQTAELKMPPKSKLPDDVVSDFEKWIAAGAADPRDGSKVIAREIDIEKGRQFWAFQPPRSVPVPSVKDNAWPRSDVDRFLLAALEAKGLAPVADADARSLIRRLTFDLTGLPPTPEDVEAFALDPSPAALRAMVDRLLDSPRFGETWGRHWLDAARFAESSGKAANLNYPHAWRYRDYVIAAFNADRPFDRFVKEQIAGDLLPAANDRQRAEQRIATGFLAVGPKAHNERNRMQFQMDLVDEQIDTTTQAFLGLTVSCARCHDHKFDPIPQKDYYALAGIFRSTETCYGTVRSIQSNFPSPLLQLSGDCGLAVGLTPLSSARREAITKQIADLRTELGKLTGSDAFLSGRAIGMRIQISNLQSQIDLYEKDGTPRLQAMGVREGSRSADVPLLGRGEIDKPGEIVPRGIPQVLVAKSPKLVGSGRQQLADWLGSRDNPLTARVYVNRVWLHLFGRGLVPTPDNFGASGQKPSNPALLDHLAIWFMDHGWSTKELIRLLTTSHAYALSTTFDRRSHESDPDNALVWRMSPRRLEAEKLRDAMLAVSGQLNLEPPAGSELTRLGEGLTFGFRGARGSDNTRRSVYLTLIREQLPESLTLFDFPDPNSVAGERPTTTVPAQALYLLNNPFVIRQAEAAGDRLRSSAGSDAERVNRAYQIFYARSPTAMEERAALDFLENYSRRSTARAAWTTFAQALFASAEFANLR